MKGHELAELRTRYGYTRESLGEILSVDTSTISDWEAEAAQPDEASLRKLSQLFHRLPEDSPGEGPAELPFFLGRLAAVFPVMVVILYLLSGFLLGLWGVTWILFLLIPVFYLCYGFYRQGKRVSLRLTYPLIVTVLYLLSGVLLHLWHPAWMMFLTIPIVTALSPGKREE